MRRTKKAREREARLAELSGVPTEKKREKGAGRKVLSRISIDATSYIFLGFDFKYWPHILQPSMGLKPNWPQQK